MLAGLAIGLVAADPASAAPSLVVSVRSSAEITTHIGAGVQQDVTITGASFSGSYNTDTKAISGSTSVPAGTFSHNALGFLPTTVTFHTDPVGPGTTGTLDLTTGAMDVTQQFNVRLSSVKMFGFFELLDPATTCKTVTPTSAHLTGNLSLTTGGTLTGSYAIPALEGCGSFGWLISLSTAGPDNTLQVTLGPPTLG